MASRYPLEKKIQALNAIIKTDRNFKKVSNELNIPRKTLQGWDKKRQELYDRYEAHCKLVEPNIIIQAHYKTAEKTLEILDSMDSDKIENAPLNQLATTLSALVGQLGKLDTIIEQDKEQNNDHDNTQHTDWTIEYIDQDGTIQEAPRWTMGDTQYLRTLQSRQLRATLGQDDSGHGDSDANRHRRGQGLVADPNQRDSRSGLEELEVERESSDGYSNQQFS